MKFQFLFLSFVKEVFKSLFAAVLYLTDHCGRLNEFLFLSLQGAEKSPDGQSSCWGEGSVHRQSPDPLHSPVQPPNLKTNWKKDEPLSQPDNLLRLWSQLSRLKDLLTRLGVWFLFSWTAATQNWKFFTPLLYSWNLLPICVFLDQTVIRQRPLLYPSQSRCCVEIRLCTVVSLHFPLKTLKPFSSRSKLQWSPLPCECTCLYHVHLTACHKPDAGCRTAWGSITSLFVMEHFEGTVWSQCWPRFVLFCKIWKTNLLLLSNFLCIRVWSVSAGFFYR